MDDSENKMHFKAQMARIHVDCTGCKSVKNALVCSICWDVYVENKNKEKDKELSMDILFEWIGDGNFETGRNISVEIAQRLQKARTKHPVFAENPAQAFEVIKAEVEEMRFEIFVNDDKERAYDECLDVIATAIRFLNEEYSNVK